MKLLTLTGPSCSGKTTMLNLLVEKYGFTSVVSHTTRAPRKGEVDGKDYYFITEDQFSALEKSGQLMEHVTFNGFNYGVSVIEIQKATEAGKTPVLIVEPNGLRQITTYADANDIELCRIFIDGDLQSLIQRYLMRGSDADLSDGETAAQHARRLASIFKEHAEWGSLELYDHKLYDYNKHTEAGYVKYIMERL